MADDMGPEDGRRKEIVAIWKAVVEVQQHFNDISMRIRAMYVTILLALFASIGFLLDKNLRFEISSVKVQFATLVPIFGIAGTYLFYFIDRHWYHRLLLGSVKHAMSIEDRYKEQMPELSLSAAIGRESPYKPARPVRWLATLLVSHEKFRQTGLLHSEGKIEFFYKVAALMLAVAALALAAVGGITIERKVPPVTAQSGATSTSAPAQLGSPPPSATTKSPSMLNPVVPETTPSTARLPDAKSNLPSAPTQSTNPPETEPPSTQGTQ